MASELLWRVHSAEEAQDPGGQGLCQVLGELSQSPSLSLEGSEMTTADQGLGLDLEPEGGPGPSPPLPASNAQTNTACSCEHHLCRHLSWGPNLQRIKDLGNI